MATPHVDNSDAFEDCEDERRNRTDFEAMCRILCFLYLKRIETRFV